MQASQIISAAERLREKRPLIHCITNPISVNQCANTVLAAGGRPIMAEHPDEVAEITRTAAAAVMNIGNISDIRMQSIMLSAACCRENNIPFALDAVGLACSSLRRSFTERLLGLAVPDLIKGNYSEIMALNGGYSASGVDSENIPLSEAGIIAAEIARKYNTVILASGKTDIVTDGKRLFHICNGTEMLSRVTGTGCMLGMLCGCFLAVDKPLSAAVSAAAIMGICGELSQTEKGVGSFMVSLMDKLSVISAEEIHKKIKLEELQLEF